MGESKNAPAAAPPTGEKERARVPDLQDRWGDLPIQVREVFRNQGGSDLPPQYRDWIDAYYRRLNGAR